MKSALLLLKYVALFFIVSTLLSFTAFWLQSDSLTIGGELLFILTVPVLFYYVLIFFAAKALLKKNHPSVVLTLVLYAVICVPLLFAVIDFEAFFNFIFSGVRIDMR